MKFIPKVGEECFITFDMSPEILPNEYIESDSKRCKVSCYDDGVVMLKDLDNKYPHHPFFLLDINLHKVKFKPAKTPAEIERDKLQSVIKNAMRLPTNNTEETLSHEIYDAGYRKQQVKPLSYEGFRSIIEGRNRLISEWYDELKPYTIQGGDK